MNLLRWIALLALAVPIALFPWMVREITGSTLAAVLSPFALLIGLWLMPLGDIYWVATWVVLLLVPLLLIIDRRWPRHGLVLLLGLLVLASVATSIRAQAGLPVLIGAALVLLRRPWSGWARSRRRRPLHRRLPVRRDLRHRGRARGPREPARRRVDAGQRHRHEPPVLALGLHRLRLPAQRLGHPLLRQHRLPRRAARGPEGQVARSGVQPHPARALLQPAWARTRCTR